VLCMQCWRRCRTRRACAPCCRFFDVFARGLMNKPKLLYVRYAELCGLMLRNAAKARDATGYDANDAIALLVPSVLRELDNAHDKRGKAKNDRGMSRFLESLQAIAVNYPPIVDDGLLSKVRCCSVTTE
jgi:hypothetical protein